MKKILVVEDEGHISKTVIFNLKREGRSPILAEDGLEALKCWEEESLELIVLDLMLPKLDGFTVLKKIRLQDKRVPILILSAKDRIEDKTLGYELGADDYLAKPFSLEEFLLKVKALTKRAEWETTSQAPQENKVNLGDFEIDLERNTAQGPYGEIVLTEQEIKLLQTFMAHPNRVLSRDHLLKESWGYSPESKSRTVDNFVVRLRKYFEKDPKNPQHFISLRGKGYLFNF